MGDRINTTRDKLIGALKKWDEQAKAEKWKERTDEGRHADNADLLIGLLKEA